MYPIPPSPRYSEYASNHSAAMQVLSRLSDNSKFTSFLAKASQNPLCRGHTLESLLILPIQRIPRYRLLLQELLKHTPPSHPDAPPLNQSLAITCDVALHVNEVTTYLIILVTRITLIVLYDPLITLLISRTTHVPHATDSN